MPRSVARFLHADKDAMSSLGVQGLTSVHGLLPVQTSVYTIYYVPHFCAHPLSSHLLMSAHQYCEYSHYATISLPSNTWEIPQEYVQSLPLSFGRHEFRAFVDGKCISWSQYFWTGSFLQFEAHNKWEQRLSHDAKYRSSTRIMARGWMKQNIARVRGKQNM